LLLFLLLLLLLLVVLQVGLRHRLLLLEEAQSCR
jgi:hypothetical protein